MSQAANARPLPDDCFWSELLRRAQRELHLKRLSPAAAALLSAALASAEKLSEDFALETTRLLDKALLRRGQSASLLEPSSLRDFDHDEEEEEEEGEAGFVDFSSVATFLACLAQSQLLLCSPRVLEAASALHRRLQVEVLVGSAPPSQLAFSDARRVLSLLAATGRSLGVLPAFAERVLESVVREQRRRRRKRSIWDAADSRDQLLFFKALAEISEGLCLPPPTATPSEAVVAFSAESPQKRTSSQREFKRLCMLRNLALQGALAALNSAVDSRLRCSPLHLATVSQSVSLSRSAFSSATLQLQHGLTPPVSVCGESPVRPSLDSRLLSAKTVPIRRCWPSARPSLRWTTRRSKFSHNSSSLTV